MLVTGSDSICNSYKEPSAVASNDVSVQGVSKDSNVESFAS